MQSLRWYVRRLSAMSPGELAWRVRGACRNGLDRWRLAHRQQLPVWEHIVKEGAPLTNPDILGTHLREMQPNSPMVRELPEPWRKELLSQADAIVRHRLRLFDVEFAYPGTEINWNFEPKAGVSTPQIRSSAIDYRDFDTTGDCKLVWEPNRHHHLVVLARAYRVSGDQRYAVEALEQLESWIRQCPYGLGMNWRSPLELGIRMINWTWTLGLLQGIAPLNPERLRRIIPIAHRHLWEIARNYSKFSSANNHLIGEAAGVLIGSSFFTSLKQSEPWRVQSHKILSEEILRQTYPDGGTREQALGYHLFVLEFFLLAGLTARHMGMDFPPSYWERLESMLEFLAALKAAGPLPLIGDADDGYVLNLGGREDVAASLLDMGAVLFHRRDFVAGACEPREPAWWLSGSGGQPVPSRKAKGMLCSKAFPDSGHYLLQRGRPGEPDAVSLVFDCGELGFESIAAHGHADALSLTLRVGGGDVLIDPGTYDYFSHPRWRRYFRSTAAHNTVVLDERDQSEMLGPFLWGRRAQARLLEWVPRFDGGIVRAEHDGYRSPADPVVHRRTVALEGTPPLIIVHDEIIARGSHDVAIWWHFSEHCRIERMEEHRYEVVFPAGRLTLEWDEELCIERFVGSEDPPQGWVSRGYHRKSPAPSLVARCVIGGSRAFTTRMTLFRPEEPIPSKRQYREQGHEADVSPVALSREQPVFQGPS